MGIEDEETAHQRRTRGSLFLSGTEHTNTCRAPAGWQAARSLSVDFLSPLSWKSEMHVWPINLLAMSRTVPELRKCTNSVPDLVRHVHVRSEVRLTLYFADVAKFRGPPQVHVRFNRMSVLRLP
jgi:hypothetical protein